MAIKKTILLTGATGFLGSNLAKKLIHRNYKVIATKRSFSNTFRLTNCLDTISFYDIDKVNPEIIFKENKIDTIIHCATSYGRKQENSIDIANANLILPLNLLMLA